ncbi:hypothetical protein LMC80_004232 [Salmonella enterica]|uniref:ASCH domain-containing protein n=3 Tax=Salmonella enterica I TaxID=59201 RepID=A0A6Y5CF56_SALDE|nr:hypothetical protein [Salmonella enterica]EAC0081757.1 hypothetical protein [Salmonella enterica subsp. enterica serovar Minnesota]EAP4747558.1 hypothetical protein [Salmonella enterica subsp. enterica serovar Meleagridis]EAY2108466.1 hypothetical protein [Salmonella enterica subsp. enterica serovar Typhimurium]EBD2227788.1 hypothetical protein [Salmonella enterica subsp. enterica serovar Lexington]EBF8101333.1 hypothetical protein [Salmonella enterica subsp. enterica serovar Nigeria]EBG34
MKYKALSIVYPAVENILNGTKDVEIRSWMPSSLPMKDLILVENRRYLNDGEIDTHAHARAMVDILSVREWTYEDYLNQPETVTIGRAWKPGYYIWLIGNVRKIKNEILCDAKKGIYEIDA